MASRFRFLGVALTVALSGCSDLLSAPGSKPAGPRPALATGDTEAAPGATQEETPGGSSTPAGETNVGVSPGRLALTDASGAIAVDASIFGEDFELDSRDCGYCESGQECRPDVAKVGMGTRPAEVWVFPATSSAGSCVLLISAKQRTASASVTITVTKVSVRVR